MGLGAIVREPPRLHHLPRRRGGLCDLTHLLPSQSLTAAALKQGVWEVLLFVTVRVCAHMCLCACVSVCAHMCALCARVHGVHMCACVCRHCIWEKMKMVFNLRKDHQAICGLFLVTFLEQRGIVFPQRYLEQNRLRGD